MLGAVGVCSGAAQFANTMAMLVTAGLPATRAVAITSRVMSKLCVVARGGALGGWFGGRAHAGRGPEASTYLPRTLVEMVAVGEHTGELEETLETMGAFYDDETQRVTNKAISHHGARPACFDGVVRGFHRHRVVFADVFIVCCNVTVLTPFRVTAVTLCRKMYGDISGARMARIRRKEPI